MITDTINQQIATALKLREPIRLSTLRMLSSSFNYERIAQQRALTQEEELSVVAREAKKRREAIDMYKNAGELERADKEQKELVVLEEFLPKQLSDEELLEIVTYAISEAGATTMADMGKVIGLIKVKVGNQADGGRIAAMVKEKLSSQ